MASRDRKSGRKRSEISADSVDSRPGGDINRGIDGDVDGDIVGKEAAFSVAKPASPPEEMEKWSSDPIRLYLSQMSHIPLLTKEEECELSKEIERTRREFRRVVMGSPLALQTAFGVLTKVWHGQLPFDRTIKMSLTERLSKEHILRRMPHNLKTLAPLLESLTADFDRLVRKSTPRQDRAVARKRTPTSRSTGPGGRTKRWCCTSAFRSSGLSSRRARLSLCKCTTTGPSTGSWCAARQRSRSAMQN